MSQCKFIKKIKRNIKRIWTQIPLNSLQLFESATEKEREKKNALNRRLKWENVFSLDGCLIITGQVISSVMMGVHRSGTVPQFSYENHHRSVIGWNKLAL